MTDHRDYEVQVESAKQHRAVPEWERRVYGVADWLDARLGLRFWTLSGLIAASLIVGTPHMLVQYQCYGRCGGNATEFNCQYFGIGGWVVADAEQSRCPRIRLL